MCVFWLIFFLTVASAKLHFEESTPNCAVNSHFYWEIFAAHFSDTSLVTINLLHDNDHHNTMSYLVDLVFKYAHVFTKLKKPLCVKHTPLLGSHHNRGTFLEGVDGRSAYVIIVWDHVILANFLDLIPEEVVRDRRGKYLILFAYNIPQLCYEYKAQVLALFWKKFGIVNVCVHIPCSCHGDKIYHYHPFLRRVNVFNISELHNKHSLLTTSLKNLHQRPLRVSMFERPPTAVKISKKSGDVMYGGVDGFVMQTLSEYLNFRLVYLETDYYKYGKILENGTAVGSLGDVVYRRVHIAGNGRFMEDYGIVEFSQPYNNDFICFIVPKSSTIPKWIMLFHCFTPMSWLAFAVIFTVSTLVWRMLRGNFIYFYAVCINNSTTITSLTHVQKLFLFSYFSYNLIFTGIFQGSLTTSFSTISYYSDITTLESLVKSGLTISSNLDIFKNDNQTIATILKNRQHPTNGIWALQRAAFQRDVAAVERRLDAIYYIQKQFLDQNGLPLVHIVEECVTSNFISLVVPKGSAFLVQFNTVIMMLNEAGLSKKWYDDIAARAIFKDRSVTLQKSDDKKALDMKDVQTAFYILIIGLGASVFVFVREVLQKRREKTLSNWINQETIQIL